MATLDSMAFELLGPGIVSAEAHIKIWSYMTEISHRQPEVWLRGPVAGVPPLLQPVAHSLLQCREELATALEGLTPGQIYARPFGAAALGFHARHSAGSLDRLFTYARGERLSALQQAELASEGESDLEPGAADRLLARFYGAIDNALAQLRSTPDATLVEPRSVGRAQLPSTVIGLLFHAAEHTQRHIGQAVTTARVVNPLRMDAAAALRRQE